MGIQNFIANLFKEISNFIKFKSIFKMEIFYRGCNSLGTNQKMRNFDNFLVIPPSFFNSNRVRGKYFDEDFFSSVLQPYNCALKKCEKNIFEKKLGLDASFEPEDIELKLSSDKRKLQIDAKKEKKFEKNGFRSYSVKEFSQTIDLPQNIDVDQLKSVINENNQLIITAPKLLSINKQENESEKSGSLDSNEDNGEAKNEEKNE